MAAKKKIKVHTETEGTGAENKTLKENDSDKKDKKKVTDPLKEMEARLQSLEQEAK